MKIFVDARMMGPETSRGIGRVVRELLLRLLSDTSVEWVVLARNEAQLAGLPGTFRPIVRDVAWYGLKEQLVLPWLLLKERPDRAFFPHWNIPVVLFVPFVCFIHDLILFHHPESAKVSTRGRWLAWLKLKVQRVLVWLVAKRARAILTPTQFVADDFAQYFPMSTDRIKVVGEGVTRLPFEETKPQVDGKYFLTVGGAYPHKRLDLVLSAWKTVSRTYPEHSLVLVGENDVFRRRLIAQSEALGLERVMFPGQATDQQLASWFMHADALLFPSEDEGFGLPPLEALSFGCPVLASDIACSREVLPSEGVVFFRNGDLDDMIRAWNGLSAAQPALREDAKRGFARAQERHSWDKTAALVRQAFNV